MLFLKKLTPKNLTEKNPEKISMKKSAEDNSLRKNLPEKYCPWKFHLKKIMLHISQKKNVLKISRDKYFPTLYVPTVWSSHCHMHNQEFQLTGLICTFKLITEAVLGEYCIYYCYSSLNCFPVFALSMQINGDWKYLSENTQYCT